MPSSKITRGLIPPTSGTTDDLEQRLAEATKTIDEQRRQLRTMAEADNQYKQVFELMSDAVLVHQRGKILYANLAAAEIYGTETTAKLLDRDFLDLVHADDHALILELRQKVSNGIRVDPAVQNGLRLDGSQFIAESWGSKITWDGAPAILVVLRDITDRDKAEMSLRASEERFSSVFNNSPAAISLKDTDGRFCFVNSRFQEWFGVTQQDVVGKTPEEVLPRELAEISTAHDQRTFEAGEATEREQEFEIASGQKRVLAITKFPVLDRNHQEIGVGTLITDVSEERRTAEQLRQAQKMEAVGQLTGGVAHDFNNLLAATMNYATLLALKLKGQDDLLALANSIVNAVERGTELTHRLLAFSRKQTLQPRSIQLGALCEGLTDLLKRTLGETIEVLLTTDDENWDVHADPGQVESALLNLAINASHAMPKGGRLVITVKNAPVVSGEWSKRWEGLPGDYVALRVADTGTGMPAHVLDHAFEPFFTTKGVGQGSGLGLSMVYGFAQQSAGFTTIDSTEGRGTTVTIYLPRAGPAQAVANTVATDTERPEGRGETILLVEDDFAVRDSTKTLLEMLGYTVLTAEDGTSALEFLSNTGPVDLLLSDLVLPGDMNGFDLYEKLHQQRPDLKCLFISGHAPLRDRRLPEGTLLLSKPIAFDELAGKLRKVLDA